VTADPAKASVPQAPPAPESEPAESQKTEFPCSNCGAHMSWDPASDALSCAYCGTKLQVPRGEGTILERPIEDAGSAARGLGIDAKVGRCGNCGARVAFAGPSISEVCTYCGSSSVLEQAANRNAIRPESLVPLDVSKDQVRASFEKWLKGLWFRPSALKRTKDFHAIGIYAPFWTFDARVHSDWSADAGYTYYVQVGKQRVRRVRWVPAWGARDDGYDDLLVDASVGVPDDLVVKLGGFDTRTLVPYRPEYLAGWRAEEYQLDLEGAWKAGQQEIVRRQIALCSSDVPGDTQRNLQVRNRISGVRWKHVLLPVWSLQYRFQGKVYTVLVSGQTGRVAGHAPWSWVKILVLLMFLGIAALVIVALANS
jgi:DNA-directed RNA polymerase subunit RPC12/RpoP